MTLEENFGPKYDDEYLKGLFGLTSDEILATGVSVQTYIVKNIKSALRNPQAWAVWDAKRTPVARAQAEWRRLALRAYAVIFASFGLLIISAIPAVERSAGTLVHLLRGLAVVGTLVVFAICVPAYRWNFRYHKLRRAEKRERTAGSR
jgi:hypothetical protein